MWKVVDKAKRIQPDKGIYSEWKEQVAVDCSHQCVYCAIGEMPWGGIDHYHIDHFRPQSKFEHLTHIISNLYYSCPICNRFKSDDWPAENDDLNNICYPDPGESDYNELFFLEEHGFIVEGKSVAAKYVVERLYLNRPQLVYERRERYIDNRYYRLESENKELAMLLDDVDLLKELI